MAMQVMCNRMKIQLPMNPTTLIVRLKPNRSHFQKENKKREQKFIVCLNGNSIVLQFNVKRNIENFKLDIGPEEAEPLSL